MEALAEFALRDGMCSEPRQVYCGITIDREQASTGISPFTLLQPGYAGNSYTGYATYTRIPPGQEQTDDR